MPKPFTRRDDNGFRMVTDTCPLCDRDTRVSMELAMHVAGITPHVGGIWSICFRCGHESITFEIPVGEAVSNLRGVHNLESDP